MLFSCSGRLAQLVERLPYKQNVGGSIPSAPTIFCDAAVVQLVRISACHAEGRGFEPRPLRHFKFARMSTLGYKMAYSVFLVS